MFVKFQHPVGSHGTDSPRRDGTVVPKYLPGRVVVRLMIAITSTKTKSVAAAFNENLSLCDKILYMGHLI